MPSEKLTGIEHGKWSHVIGPLQATGPFAKAAALGCVEQHPRGRAGVRVGQGGHLHPFIRGEVVLLDVGDDTIVVGAARDVQVLLSEQSVVDGTDRRRLAWVREVAFMRPLPRLRILHVMNIHMQNLRMYSH